MRLTTAFIAAILTCTLGCDTVTVDAPFGDSVPTTTLESFRGTWSDKQGNIFFVDLGATSDLVVGVTKWNSGANAFETQSVPLSIRTLQNRTFLFIPLDARKTDKLVFVWLSEIEDGTIFAKNCSADAFREAVSSGTLDGTIIERKNDHFDVHLENLETLKTVLASPLGSKLFDAQGGDPLRRLTPVADGEPSVEPEATR